MSSKELVPYLYKLSEAKLTLMKDLMKKTKEQAKAIENEDTELLNKTIEDKNKIIEKIDLLDNEFLQKYERLKNYLGVESLEELSDNSQNQFKELKGKVSQITKETDKIKQVDRKNMQKMKQEMEKVQSNIQTVKKGKKAVKGYNEKYSKNSSIFIDQKK